eukprot:gene21003-7850_t
MRLSVCILGVVFGLCVSVEALKKTRCQRGQPCWPTKADVGQLYVDLDPNAKRQLRSTADEPYHCSIPINSPYLQP